jgi:hypothetical protein
MEGIKGPDEDGLPEAQTGDDIMRLVSVLVAGMPSSSNG